MSPGDCDSASAKQANLVQLSVSTRRPANTGSNATQSASGGCPNVIVETEQTSPLLQSLAAPAGEHRNLRGAPSTYRSGRQNHHPHTDLVARSGSIPHETLRHATQPDRMPPPTNFMPARTADRAPQNGPRLQSWPVSNVRVATSRKTAIT